MAAAAVLMSVAMARAPGSAAEQPTAPEPPGTASEVLSALGDAAGSVGGALGSAWHRLGSVFAATQPQELLPEQLGPDDRMFFGVLESVGLRLADVSMSDGMFSRATYHFVAARDPSGGDVRLAEHKLDEYRDKFDGMRARAKQRIVVTVLEMAADPNFLPSSVEVELWPWPSARFAVAARNRPSEPGDRRGTPASPFR